MLIRIMAAQNSDIISESSRARDQQQTALATATQTQTHRSIASRPTSCNGLGEALERLPFPADGLVSESATRLEFGQSSQRAKPAVGAESTRNWLVATRESPIETSIVGAGRGAKN